MPEVLSIKLSIIGLGFLVGMNIVLLLGAVVGKNMLYKGPKSENFDGIRFFNTDDVGKRPGFVQIVKWQFCSYTPWPKRKLLPKIIPDIPPSRVTGPCVRAVFVNHATVLLQLYGLNILTDPVWSKRLGPWPRIFAQARYHNPGIVFDDLPSIDIVLISHSHYDHLDMPTLKRLIKRDDPLIIAGLGVDSIISKNSSRIKTLDWGQSYKATDQVSIHFCRCQHWSGRSPWDVNRTLWGAFAVQTSAGTIYFAGDTGYGNGSHFKAVRKKFGPIKLALLPIGAYQPRWFMKYAHMNPADAVQAHQDLGAEQSIAIHFYTFPLANEGINDSVHDLSTALVKNKISSNRFCAYMPGEGIICDFSLSDK